MDYKIIAYGPVFIVFKHSLQFVNEERSSEKSLNMTFRY